MFLVIRVIGSVLQKSWDCHFAQYYYCSPNIRTVLCWIRNCKRGAALLKDQSNCFWKPGSFRLCQIWKQKILRCFFFLCVSSQLFGEKERCRVDMVIEYGAARDKIHECCEGGYKGWGDMEADHPL